MNGTISTVIQHAYSQADAIHNQKVGVLETYGSVFYFKLKRILKVNGVTLDRVKKHMDTETYLGANYPLSDSDIRILKMANIL